MATFRRRRLKDLKFTVSLALPNATQEFGWTGGCLTSREDPSVNIRVPEESCSVTATVNLQVLPQELVREALCRLENRGIIDDVSALSTVLIKGACKKPLSLEAKLASGDASRPLLNRKNVHVMMSPDGVHWSECDPEYRADPERFSVNLDQESQSVMFLRTRGYATKEDLLSITRAIVRKLKEFPVTVIVGQKDNTPNLLRVQCCHSANAEEGVQKLQEAGYHIDGNSVKELHLRDGTQLQLAFNAEGNIDFTPDNPSRMNFTYLSKMDMSKEGCDHATSIRVKNTFCQKQHTVYRGKLQVCDVSDDDNGEDVKPLVLCQFPVTLPKAQSEPATPAIKPVQYFYGEEPLTEAYTRSLSEDISIDWLELASHLGLQAVTVQQIKQRNTELSDRAYDMLRTWYMKSKKDGMKAERLIEALRQTGRDELASELYTKNQAVTEAKRLRIKEQLFAKIAKRISADPRALDNWKGILRSLTLSDEVLSQIEGGTGNRISRLQSGLAEWLHSTGDRANPAVLMSTLKKMGYHAAAEQVSFCLVK